MRPGLVARVLPLVAALAACGDDSGSTDRTGADVGVESDLPLRAACALLTVGPSA